ncbi:putative clathrin assembly protein At4g40080 [Ipomoea triloba]|uniref:putative clathrin assembly protein At4g40080 n=1 Tax=Ipomoea triloba TaxID=35885 RepID=UPI00125CD8B5|nr:putative clathrin assembly protein At4g40080 [Ipomoea triloba]
MGRITAIMGAIKDKASQSKAALLSNPTTTSLNLAVLRATTHSPSAPPDLSALLSLGNSSRATASALISALMDRLHRTGDSTVALKCLLTIHHVITRGPFILQDQLSIFPASGGRNYLKLSAFRDGASAATLTLSAWVRFYARYLETLLFASRILGYFVSASSTAPENLGRDERISAFLNHDLIRDVDSLVVLIEETCKAPDSFLLESNKLIHEIMRLLSDDNFSILDETLSRLTELKQRMDCLSFGDSVELALALRRLEDCTERLSVLFTEQKSSIENSSSLAIELREKIETSTRVCKERRLLSFSRKCESARFPARVANFEHMVRISSDKYIIDNNVL